jgi:nicotinate-nucleotide adenylyltransferase
MTPASQDEPRVAFFGGSFDPPHIGHVAVASAAQQALALDRILFAPVGLQPLKPAGSSASFSDRVAMLRLAIAGHPSFEVSLLDAPDPASPGPNYTFDTLTELCKSLPSEAKLFLLLGADSFRTLHYWHRAAELLFLASLIVASRPHESLGDLPANLPPGVTLDAFENHPNRYRLTNAAGSESCLTILPGLNYDISATQLRTLVHGSTDQPPLLDPNVLEYIQQHDLYR